MRLWPSRLSALLALAAIPQVWAQAPAASGHGTRHLSDAAKAELSTQLSNAVQRGDTAGVVAAIVGRDQAMVPNAIFSIASMTKPVTSVAIMMLFEQGKLKLDDPVSKYLPGFDSLRVITKFNEKDASYQTRPATRPMTIRHLLTHTSGIAYSFSNPIENRLTQATKIQEWKLPLLNDPGDKWNYGPSRRLLGMIVEKITGVPLEAWFQQNIFQPLGMVDTSYAVPVAKQARVPTQHQRVKGLLQEQPRDRIPATPVPPFGGDGGLYSTVQDYGRFVQMMLNGGRAGSQQSSVRILQDSSVKMMGENNIGSVFVELQPGADQSLTKPFPIGAGRDKFGLGFQTRKCGH